jgi:hypothetical protein
MERRGFDHAQKIRVYGGKAPHTRLTSRLVPEICFVASGDVGG